jgi:hypothetical protein
VLVPQKRVGSLADVSKKTEMSAADSKPLSMKKRFLILIVDAVTARPNPISEPR